MRARLHEDLIPTIDLFAGPGGLGEGFARFRSKTGEPGFRIALSVEKDPVAHKTLFLRSFVRQFFHGRLPAEYYAYIRGEIALADMLARHPQEASRASHEAWHAELGSTVTPHRAVRDRIHTALRDARCWVLIGGPPCQAYSIAGRSRNRAKKGYSLEADHRHNLYEEYLRIVADHWPPIFVMENVKGLLSTTLRDEMLFDRICEDLCDPGRSLGMRRRRRYRIVSLEEPTNSAVWQDSVSRFVVRAEHHGVPQCRHRIILLGVREDLGDPSSVVLPRLEPVPARKVLDGLPCLRSGLSRNNGRASTQADSPAAWHEIFRSAIGSRWVDGNARIEKRDAVRSLIVQTIESLTLPKADRGGEFVLGRVTVKYEPKWYLDDQIGGACNHSTRTHMDRDLYRYLFAACFAQVNRRSPRLRDFPPDLLPEHHNVAQALNGGFFNDRFRVQLYDEPATTITSHIHKDGHYYIHPDPSQCRSLTVREAARLQTFPDNYFFAGPRTEQYIQVGNAVPPILARQIAAIVHQILRDSGQLH